MPKSLVIVESPAKARTIAGFLGDDFIVKSSMGHVRDLETSGLSVDVDNGFKPTYVVPPRSKEVVRELKAALKGVDTLYLATDEDREGESISWHLLEVLNPQVPVKRMVFHEITRSAIEAAVENWRDVDYGLVDAADTRRIVDRLFGYPVSEVLWRKVNRGLSAGRVQSVATRLVVERERERIRFVSAGYWDLDAAFATSPTFNATLLEVGGQRVATGKDFDESGTLQRGGVVVLDEPGARDLVTRLENSAFVVRSTEEKPYRSSPKPPFSTSTLQQEGGRKLRLGARDVMRVAQGLYERGYITYMRTDSVSLSETAITAARNTIGDLYGRDYLPDRPRAYANKSKNAQEAHEAIRPAGEQWRTPEQLRGGLRGSDLRLYELIWMRTVASQMADATGRTVSVRIGATTADGRDTLFGASGRTITFPGYMRAYVEGSDDPDAELDDRESILPPLAEGDAVPLSSLEANGHATNPPPRFTEASLVKRMEELGVGRPSTYASTINTIQERGYVRKRGTALVATWTAFAVTNLLERHFSSLVDYAFTARMEDDLDLIAAREKDREPWLHEFWFGSEMPGLHQLTTAGLADIDPVEINSIPLGEGIVLRVGKYGPYLQRGDERASVPEELAPDELTVEKAEELLAAPSGDRELGIDPDTGLTVSAKAGRYGPYVQLGGVEPGSKQKPPTASLLSTMDLDTVTLQDGLRLLTLPRVVGVDPADGEEITAQNGRYGPYIKKGKDSRSLDNEEQMFSVTLDAALAIFAQPKLRRGQQRTAAEPLKELGPDPASGQPVVVRDGRFGPYVTDGEINASLRAGDTVEAITIERAAELLELRREAGPAKKRTKKTPAKKATGKKTATKKTAAPKRKTATKKTAAKKTPVTKATGKKQA